MTILKELIFCSMLSMVPIAELRVAIPLGLANGLPPLPLYLICVFFNLLPVPFIILFLRKILLWMKSRKGLLNKISLWIELHGQKKLKIYRKYELIGLFILVAVPLPGTGTWTGALVAALMGLRLKSALPAIGLGAATAGVVVTLISGAFAFI